MSSPSPLIVRELSKSFGGRPVLEKVSLEVQPGELVALTGPNGSGKSTLISCICGQVDLDAGEVEIGGAALLRDPLGARRALRYLAQEPALPSGLSGQEWLDFCAAVFSDPAAMNKAHELAQLEAALPELLDSYSVGMRRRLAIAGCAFGGAALYLLDEPFAGLDRDAVVRVRSWIQELLQAGRGVLIAAHEQDLRALEEVEQRCVELRGRQAAQ